MNRYAARAIATFIVVGLLPAWIVAGHARAQIASESQWQSTVAARLKGIYEQGEFRSQAMPSKWFDNSSGYTIQERDAKTGKSIDVSFDLRTGERIERPVEGARQNERRNMVSPDGSRILEYQDKNLFVREQSSGKRTQLTKHDAGQEISYQKPKWSPDGKQVLFVETNVTHVKLRPVLIPSDPSYPEVQKNRFARVGESLETHRVGVVSLDGQEVRWIPLSAPKEGMYLGQVEWAGNSEEVLIETFSRFRDHREFLLAKAGGGLTKIYEETNEAWAESSQGRNSGLTWIRGGEAFVVVSEKDGWRHAFLYSRDGKEIAVLTPGAYDVIERATIDEAAGWYYFYASPENGTEKYLYRVPLDGTGRMERITPQDQPGTHVYDFSPDAKWAFHTYSTLDTPPVVELVEISGHRKVRIIEDNQSIREKMKSIGSRPTEFLKLEIGQGISMDAWMLKPRDFDPSKKYPVFVYVYGEPHAQTVLNEWGTAHIDFHRVVADLGYVVVSIDNRGTPAPKGAAWRRAIFGSLGPLSTEEQETGLKQLEKQCPFVDLSRVGIWGWSGGGSNTLNAMFRKPESYHVGIAVVPKPQPHLYNAWFQEIFMRTREVNPEGYARSAPLHFAEGLKGKLLIITGSGETNTHIQIIEGLIDRLIELGKTFDYMVYPNRDHGLREGAGTLVHVRMLIIRYLKEHLPSGPR